ncbi:hypothetical protein BJ138DRAFT_967579, partial [Hygrophoropsis aurantiaca]
SERLSKKWTSPIYGFYHPVPEIEYVGSRRCHTFQCASRRCSYKCRRFLDTCDANSTGNLRKHARICWGEDALKAAAGLTEVDDVRQNIVESLNETGSITMAFERKGKGKVTYSNRQHTRTETRAEIVRWVAESMRPFTIVKDRGFQSLMKTGRPDYYIPSPSTVARDVKTVFASTRRKISKLLQ